MSIRGAFWACVWFAVSFEAAGCGQRLTLAPQPAMAPDVLTPAGRVVSLNATTGKLEYWLVNPRGGHKPAALSPSLGLRSAFVAAAAGTTIVLGAAYPPAVVTYDLSSQRRQTLPDPFGTPIDVAVDRRHNLYALNYARAGGSVTKYGAASGTATKMACALLGLGEAIAVDNEGDVFVNGYPPHESPGVVEISSNQANHGAPHCVRLHLRTEPGYVAGIAVDPKTDDLIVFDDPDECAGGLEGRMTIYPKPYEKSTAIVRELGANCAGGIRLNATSSLVFFLDETVSGGRGFISQRTYPEGKGTALYAGGNSAGLTTLPNTLPN